MTTINKMKAVSTKERKSSMLQLIGVLMILNSLIVTIWWAAQQKSGFNSCIVACLIAIFCGFVLIFNERAVEISIAKVGTLKAAAEQAQVDAHTIAEIKTRIEGQAATVDAVAKAAADAKRVSEEVQKKNEQAVEKLAKIDEELKRGSGVVADLKVLSEFQKAVLAAQNDDRKAFDQLSSWSTDKQYQFSTEAEKAWATVLDAHESPIMVMGSIDWMPGLDPQKLPFEVLKQNFAQAAAYNRVKLVDFIWGRTDLPKIERMKFLVDVIRDDLSLNVVDRAASHFAGASGDKYKRLYVRGHLDWWEKNKDLVK